MAFFSKFFKGSSEPGLPAAELARRLNVDLAILQNLPILYHEVRFPKRTTGFRVLNVPSDPLKQIQRTILRRLLAKLSAHPAAMGFERDKSIAMNAAAHVGAQVLIKMDLKDFFANTTAARVHDYFVKIGWGGEAATLLTKLTTYNGGLPQGAPTSPRLSNLVNYLLDARLFAYSLKVGIKYTRYADDMTFSNDGHVYRFQMETMKDERQPAKHPDKRALVANIIQHTKRVVKEQGYTLHQNKKLQIRRRHHRMLVTGIVINDGLNLPRETRRKLRAVRHHLKTGRPATMTTAQLQGWDALNSMIVSARPTVPPSPPL